MPASTDRLRALLRGLEVRGYHDAERIDELPLLECELVP
jgi:hypothetical protein